MGAKRLRKKDSWKHLRNVPNHYLVQTEVWGQESQILKAPF